MSAGKQYQYDITYYSKNSSVSYQHQSVNGWRSLQLFTGNPSQAVLHTVLPATQHRWTCPA